jgi:hypothetical protein
MTMDIPVPWAIALAVAAAMGVVVVMGIAAHRGAIAAPERGLAHTAHLLGGGLTGFLALAFPPAWPPLAAIVGMLTIRAVRARRILDIGLLLAGFGSAWALLLGISIINVRTDPAVTASDVTGWFAFAVAVLVMGLAVTLAGSGQSAGRSEPAE